MGDLTLPHEGQTSVTIATLAWNKADAYFTKHKAKLKKEGIHSTSALIEFWIRENALL